MDFAKDEATCFSRWIIACLISPHSDRAIPNYESSAAAR